MKKVSAAFAIFLFFIINSAFCGCSNVQIKRLSEDQINQLNQTPRVITGDERPEKYLPYLKNKKAALFEGCFLLAKNKIYMFYNFIFSR